MAILKQKSAFGPGVYRGHRLSLEKLRSFVEGTNKAIKAGVPIPLLLKHAPINASDDETEQFASADGKGAGWITSVAIEDGAIAWEAKDVPEAVLKAKEAGTLRFTSPEFRPHYVCEKAGVYEGPVIRHFAFTPLPGNPHQGEIETLALSEDCWQFTEGECEPLDAEQFNEVGKPVANKDHYGTFHVKFHSGEHAGKSATFSSIIPKRYSKEQTTYRGKLHGKFNSESARNITCTGDHLCKNAHYHTAEDSQHGEDMDDSEQFYEEGNTGHKLLQKHGFKMSSKQLGTGKADTMRSFSHGKHGLIEHYSNGSWNHYNGGKLVKEGQGHTDLHNHLRSLASQHGEDMDNVTPPSTMPPDEHYKNSLSVDAHKPGVTNPSGEDESIDWDNLTVQEHNKVLAKIEAGLTDEDNELGEEAMFHKQHGGQHMMKEPFGSTGNPAPWVEDEGIWSKAKKVIGNRYGGEGNRKYWAVVTSVYKKMGGKVNKQSQHAEDPKDNNPMDEQTKKKKAEDLDTEESAESESSTPPETMQPDVNTNPDMPPKATDKSKLSAVLAGLNQKGIVLPSDFCFDDEHSIDVLLAAINSSIKAEMEAEAEAEPDDEDNKANVTDAPMPFSEEDLAALPVRVRQAILREQEQLQQEREKRKQAELKAQQYEEEKENLRNETARNEAVSKINAAKIPPTLKNRLLASYQSSDNCVQFSEGKEKPSFSGVEVAEMLASSLPPSLQFEVEDVKEAESPKGQIKVGTDAYGNAVYREEANSTQFFETTPDGQLLGAMHVDPARAEELVKHSPIGLVNPRGSMQLPPPTTMRR